TNRHNDRQTTLQKPRPRLRSFASLWILKRVSGQSVSYSLFNSSRSSFNLSADKRRRRANPDARSRPDEYERICGFKDAIFSARFAIHTFVDNGANTFPRIANGATRSANSVS